MQGQAVRLEAETELLGNFDLQTLDFRMEKFFDPPTVQTEQVIVMVASLQFENSPAQVDIGPPQQTRLLELQEHSINRTKTKRNILVQQGLLHIFGAHMTHPPRLESSQNPLSGQGSLQTNAFEFLVRGHD